MAIRLHVIDDFGGASSVLPNRCAFLNRPVKPGEKVLNTGIEPRQAGWKQEGMIQLSQGIVEEMARQFGMQSPDDVKNLRLQMKAAKADARAKEAIIASKQAEIEALRAQLELAEAVRDDAVKQAQEAFKS